jgi:formylglycine-generating enzyme required for sulfatase activity
VKRAVALTAWTLGCAADPPALDKPDASVDSADSGAPVSSDAPCDVAFPGDGTPVGLVDCADGRCFVPAGEAVRGTNDPAFPDSCPPHRVTLSAFLIGETEVTRGDYARCVADGACTAPEPSCWDTVPIDVDAEVEFLPDNAPATCISVDEARAYCASVGGRLPSEAEWEVAARGEEGADWPWGARPPICADANFRFSSSYCHLGLVPVGFYSQESPFGLRDTVGNAWEWTNDAYDAGYYRDGPRTDPPSPSTCRSTPDGPPGECTFTVVRGGAYTSTEATTRGGVRSFARPDTRDPLIGFRCAWDAVE